MASIDQTLSRSYPDDGAPIRDPRPHVFVALDADAPRSRAARVSLVGIDVVHIGRGAALSIDRDERELWLTLPNRRASSKHAILRKQVGQWSIEDCGSKNGTLVNRAPVESAHLTAGDLIEIGNAFLLYELAEPAEDATVDPDRSGLATVVPRLEAGFEALRKIAATDTEVLVRGETGTGKELVSRAVHDASRRTGPFVPVNCGALPSTLVEAHLFGHVKGAFTGADTDGIGLVRAAHGGTLMLDEIGDLPLAAQAALLRALQERRVLPVGASSSVSVDFRLVAATHRDLDAMVANGSFREDLLARVAGFTFVLPAVRHRRADLGLLVGALLDELAPDRDVALSPDAALALLCHRWPRNVRELRNVLRSALALADDTIAVDHLPDLVRAATPANEPTAAGADAAERAQLIALLEDNAGNVAAVARALGKARMQVYRDAKRLGVDVEGYRG